MDVNHQKFPKRERDPMKSKNFLVQKLPNLGKVRGGSQSLGTVPKFYRVINYDGFPQSALDDGNMRGSLPKLYCDHCINEATYFNILCS